jgi:hypothetical protein
MYAEFYRCSGHSIVLVWMYWDSPRDAVSSWQIIRVHQKLSFLEEFLFVASNALLRIQFKLRPRNVGQISPSLFVTSYVFSSCAINSFINLQTLWYAFWKYVAQRSPEEWSSSRLLWGMLFMHWKYQNVIGHYTHCVDYDASMIHTFLSFTLNRSISIGT